MANISNLDDYRKTPATSSPKAGLKGGDGGGTFDDMDRVWQKLSEQDRRFEKIEGKIDGLSGQVTDLRVGLATITERVAHLPTKEFIWKGIAGLIAAMAAIVTFAPKLQQLFGVIPK